MKKHIILVLLLSVIIRHVTAPVPPNEISNIYTPSKDFSKMSMGGKRSASMNRECDKNKRSRTEELKKSNASQSFFQQNSPEYGPLDQFLDNLIHSDHFLYMLYYPIGTMDGQLNSCFYFGISKNIQNRLKYHKSHMKKENPEKWQKFHGLECLPVVAIVELYSGSISECEHLERELIRHGNLLNLSLTNIQFNDEKNVYSESNDTEIFKLLMTRGLESGTKYYSNSVKWNADKLESVSVIMKSANAKRRSNATVREKEAATMRAKRLNDDYREEENAKHVEYIRNLPEEADDERRLLAKKSNSLGNLRRKNKDVKGKVTAWNWFRQMVGPEIRKDLQTSNPEMNGQEFSRMWGAKVGEKWRSLSKDERKPFKDRAVADEIRYKKEFEAHRLEAACMDETREVDV